MTTVTGTISDVAGRPDDRAWVFTSMLREGSGSGEVITQKWVRTSPVDGDLSVDIEPGFCIVNAPDGLVYNVTVPGSAVDIWDLIAAAVAFPPGTSADAVASAVIAYLAASPISPSHIGLAESQVINYDPVTGFITSVVEDGVTTTFASNPDGTVDTDTRSGVTRQYTYDASGNLTEIEAI